jgi:hypothetical protein
MEYEVQASNLDGLDDFTRGYLECAEWCGLMDEDREAFEAANEIRWSEAALKQARQECDEFRAHVGGMLSEWEASEAGHDFWLTRNGHGAGFWDRGRKHGDELTKAAKIWGGVDVYFDKEQETLEFH